MPSAAISAKHVLINARVLYGGYDFSGLNQVDLDNGLDAVEVTEFGNQNHVYAPGLSGAKFSMGGFVKYGEMGNEVQMWNNRYLIKELAVSPTGIYGDPVKFYRVMNGGFKSLGSIGQANKFTGSLECAKEEPVLSGFILEDGITAGVKTPKLASGTSTPFQLGATGALESLYAQLHAYQVPLELAMVQLTANVNDYAPIEAASSSSYARAGMSYCWSLLLSSDASRNITGLTGGYAGRIIKLTNSGSQNIVLKHASGSSLAANQFNLAGGVDLTLAPTDTVKLGYNTGTSKWDVVVTAFPSLIVKLQSDALVGFGSPTDVWTFSTVTTTAGSQFKKISGPITDDWYRISWTIVGGGPYGVFAGAAIL